MACLCEICNKSYSTNGSLKMHIKMVHDKIKDFECELCEFKCSTNGSLKTHIKRVHDKIKDFECELCEFKCSTNGDLKAHIKQVHDKIKDFECELCDYKCSTNSHLKMHIKRVHNKIKDFECELCDYKCSTNGSLQRHKEHVHDQGKHKCDFCLNHRNSAIVHNDNQGKHSICKECYRKVTGFSNRIEKDWSEYLDSNFGTEYLIGSDKSLQSLGGCQKYRPDKLYASPDLVLMLECDEHQHKYHEYSCDEKRISDIYEEFSGKKLIVIRWNPDKCKNLKISRHDRMVQCVRTMKNLLKNPPSDIIHVYYMYFDEDEENSSIVKNLPKTFL